MSNNDFSTNMGYNRKISSSGGTSASRVSPSSWNFDTDIDEYTRTNVNLSKETITEEDGSINLDMFLEPESIETIEKADITDGLELESTDIIEKEEYEIFAEEESKAPFIERAAATVVECGASFLKGFFKVGENIVDGVAQLGSIAVVGISEVANFFGADIDTQAIKDSTQAFVSTDG